MRVDPSGLLWVAAFAFLACIPLNAQETKPPAEPSEEVDQAVLDELKLIAQRAALPVLGGEKPFILRESSWSGEVEPGKSRLIQVQLFKRNDYHFWIAAADRRAGLNLNLYNGKGELLETVNPRYETSNVAGLSFTPDQTGIYYLRLSMQTTIDIPQRWTVIYAYR